MSQGGPEKSICGLASEASLFFQAIEQKMDWKTEWHRKNYGTYIRSGIPENIGDLFLQAYQAGARVHTNSWGGGEFGAYDEQSHDLDAFVWEHKDMVILFAAGNDGKDVNRDGKIDTESITPPATPSTASLWGHQRAWEHSSILFIRILIPLLSIRIR